LHALQRAPPNARHSLQPRAPSPAIAGSEATWQSSPHPTGQSPKSPKSPKSPPLGAGSLDARRDARLTQEELAKRIGADKSYISRIERGITVPSVATFYRIVSALGRSVELTPMTGFGLREKTF
jgi:DNA-binding XRE family transcriptional regulator